MEAVFSMQAFVVAACHYFSFFRVTPTSFSEKKQLLNLSVCSFEAMMLLWASLEWSVSSFLVTPIALLHCHATEFSVEIEAEIVVAVPATGFSQVPFWALTVLMTAAGAATTESMLMLFFAGTYLLVIAFHDHHLLESSQRVSFY